LSTLPPKHVKIAKSTVTQPLAPIAPNLTSAQKNCDQLKSQLQAQLPLHVLQLMHWQVMARPDPVQPGAPLLAVCQLQLATDGATIEKLGLTPAFMTAALERLDWSADAALNIYAADSATAHREAMRNGAYKAIISYEFAPPVGACPNNQPIAACKVTKKKWLYHLELIVESV
jgi:hypothetical protein